MKFFFRLDMTVMTSISETTQAADLTHVLKTVYLSTPTPTKIDEFLSMRCNGAIAPVSFESGTLKPRPRGVWLEVAATTL